MLHLLGNLSFAVGALMAGQAPGRHHAIFIALERDPGSLVSGNTTAGKVWLLKSSLVHNYGYVASDVVTLSADHATKADIDKMLAGLSDKATYAQGDDLLVYYVGYRAEVKGEMYLQTSDTQVSDLGGSDTSGLQKTGLSARELFGGLGKCACGKILVVTDGTLAGTDAIGPEDKAAFNGLTGDREWVSTKPADDSPSAFTDALFGFLEKRKPAAAQDLPNAVGLTTASFFSTWSMPGFKFEPVEAVKE